MNMRDMKAREMRNREALASGRVDARMRAVREHERPPEAAGDDDSLALEVDESLAAGEDGSFSVRRGRGRQDDEDGGDLPSEPPPGWLDP